MPLVTILMPVFNGARFLRTAVDSVLEQTMSDFEFIIVNDGSTDTSKDILASYHDPRLRVLDQENRGLAAALNRGLRAARTELLVRMDADDFSVPQRIETLLQEYESRSRPDVMGSAIRLISATGNVYGSVRYPESHQEILNGLDSGGATFAHPAVIYKRSVVLASGGYDEWLRTGSEDHDLWHRLSRHCRFANCRHALLQFRIWPGSVEKRDVRLKPGRRTSSSWLNCVVEQKRLLANYGRSHYWEDLQLRDAVLGVLWERYRQAGIESASVASRSLQLVRAEMSSPGLRIRGLHRLVALLAQMPYSTLRYILRRSLPTLSYLTADELTQIDPLQTI